MEERKARIRRAAFVTVGSAWVRLAVASRGARSGCGAGPPAAAPALAARLLGRQPLLLAVDPPLRQLDAALRVDVDHLHVDHVADLHVIGDLLDVAVRQLGDVDETLLAGEQLDERAKLL